MSALGGALSGSMSFWGGWRPESLARRINHAAPGRRAWMSQDAEPKMTPVGVSCAAMTARSLSSAVALSASLRSASKPRTGPSSDSSAYASSVVAPHTIGSRTSANPTSVKPVAESRALT